MKTFIVNDAESEAANLRSRVANAMASNQVFATVQHIVDDVAKDGDRAIIDYTKKLDGVQLKSLLVKSKEIDEAYTKVSNQQIKSIRVIRDRLAKTEATILKNFFREIESSIDGITIKRYAKPLRSAGCYIPGGKARYPSTVIMCVVPAKVAKVRRIVAASPPLKDGSIDPLTLVAADICGVDEFYKVGGAQGIAALAFGTSTIRKVNKIVGPGGVFVTLAKIFVSQNVSVDMVAGPTELLVYADSTSPSRLVAMDIVSQAEHGYDTFCGLVTTSKRLAAKVLNDIDLIINKGNISRAEIVRESLSKNGFIAVARDQSTAIAFANELAPEHLEILSSNARSISKRITSAGLTLVGKYTPSSASDYCLGSNHVLPTMGFAKSRSSLSVLDFLKVVNTVEASREELNRVGWAIKEITSAEGLLNHYEAVKIRLRGI
ncbi:MAG: histidinol dehydrogenase [Thermoproteota archaeon]|nr:histidinol dehydrogenase [Thermoproteota archaeon]